MKRTRLTAITATIFLAIFLIMALPGAASTSYTTTQLTDNATNSEFLPQINITGQVVWSGWNGITLFSGGTTTQLASSGSMPQINDSGQVVWEDWDGSDTEICLYSSGTTTKLTDNDYPYNDSYPQINAVGQVIWASDAGSYDQIYELFLYSPDGGGQATMLTDNAYLSDYNDHMPQLNNAGEVVWLGWDGHDSEVYLFSDGVTTKLTDNAFDDVCVQINNLGQVVWQSTGWEHVIYMYSDGVITGLPWNWGTDPQINDSGQVVFVSYDYSGNDYEVFLFSSGVITNLTNNAYSDLEAKINNAGQVFTYSSTGIDVYSDGQKTSLLPGGSGYQINDSGQVVWEGYDGTDYEIYLASPATACTGGQPQLSLSESSVFWASYADYTNGVLSVDYGIANGGSDDAYGTQIVGSVNAAGVISVNTPLAVGNISAGGSAPATVTYHVPAGVGSFSTVVYAVASDDCGTSYSYPGPYPGS